MISSNDALLQALPRIVNQRISRVSRIMTATYYEIDRKKHLRKETCCLCGNERKWPSKAEVDLLVVVRHLFHGSAHGGDTGFAYGVHSDSRSHGHGQWPLG